MILGTLRKALTTTKAIFPSVFLTLITPLPYTIKDMVLSVNTFMGAAMG